MGGAWVPTPLPYLLEALTTVALEKGRMPPFIYRNTRKAWIQADKSNSERIWAWPKEHNKLNQV
jgi:hypothetical protein